MKLVKCFATANCLIALLTVSVAGCFNNSPSSGVVINDGATDKSRPKDDDKPDENENKVDEHSTTLPNGEPKWEDFASATFSNPTKIDNRWFPLKPGTQFLWEGSTVDDEGDEEAHWVVFTVTDLTREIAGITTVVCWDQDYVADPGEAFEDAELVETEIVFFAQSDDGAVWHFGQYPEEYEDGNLIAAPGWLHGIGTARAGIHMPADPKLGDRSFAQGWAPDVPWTDRAVVFAEGKKVEIPHGSFEDVIIFDEFNLEEPDSFQQKYYASGVGNVKVGWRGEAADEEVLDLMKVVELGDAELAEARTTAQELGVRADVLYAKLKEKSAKVSSAPKETDDGPKIDFATLGTEEFGLTKRQLVQKIEEVEGLIAKYMREEGFEYVACDYQTVRKGMIADKSLPGMRESEFIAQYGFGVSTTYTGLAPQMSDGYSPTRVGLGEQNIAIYKNLSPADQVAYNRALFGSNTDASFAVGLETENFSRCGGATLKAISEVFEEDQLKPNYYNPKDAIINKDPRMKAALRQYAEEMRKEGFTYNHPDEVETDLREQLAAITGGESIPLDKFAPEKQDALKKLQEYERRVAVTSFELQEEIFDPVEEQIEKEMFARAVK